MIVTRGLQSCMLLVPLLTWTQHLGLEELALLVEPMRKMLPDMLRTAAAGVPAFQQLPELQRLLLMWLDHVVPMVADNITTNSPARWAARRQLHAACWPYHLLGYSSALAGTVDYCKQSG
jgi:hypothetical protein